MKRLSYIITLTSLSLLFSCKTGLKDNPKIEYITEPITEAQSRAERISVPNQKQRVRGEWIILNSSGKAIDAMDERAYINFSPREGKIYGFTGCNYINGDFNIENNDNIEFSNIITTTRHCDAISDENNILNALGTASKFIIYKKSDLYFMDLEDAAGKRIMHTKRHNADVLTGVWKINTIHGKNVSNQEIDLVIDIPELKLYGNLGCNRLNGTIGLDRNKDWFIQFYSITSTNNNCNDTALNLERDLLIALEEVEYIDRKDHNNVRLLDKDKKEVLSLKRSELETKE